MKKEPKFLNTGKEIENESLVNQEVLVRKLNELLKEKKLSATTIEQESKNLGITFAKLGYLIFFESGLSDEFYNYAKELEGNKFYSNEEIRDLIASFLEKVQQKPEPTKVEQEPQAVDVPVAPVATAITIEEEPQPAVAPPQVSEAQKLIEYEKKEGVKMIPDLSVSPRAPETSIAEPAQSAKTIEVIPQPERKNWWEVKRETEVMAIEDLDGKMSKFKKHVKELGVAEEDANGDWQWTGGNKKLVFLGDILGDRNMFGTEIAFNIGGLTEQAEKEGGQVDFLCGNHDMAFINFLCKSWKEIDNDMARRLSDQYIGIWELAKFDPNPNSEFKKIDPFSVNFRNSEGELWQRLYDKMPEILAGMRSDGIDKYFLEDICRIKVAVVYDDILYCHTDPTTAMVPDLTKDGNIVRRVAEVNKIFQENLRKAIFDGEKLSGEFREIEEIYLNTDNRSYFVEDELSVFSGAANILLKNIINKVLDIDKDKLFLWVSWKEQVFKRSSLINLDRAIIIESIEEWERDNNLAGNYIDEIIDILNAFKHNNKKEVNAKEEVLLEKIIRLNQKNDNIEKVRNSGINAIIHGHSPLYDRFYDEKGLIIVSPHGGFSGAGDKGGVSTVRENGRIDLIGKSFRVKKPV